MKTRKGIEVLFVVVGLSAAVSAEPVDIDSLCPPRPETAAKYEAGAYPAAARDYREAAFAAYRYMISLLAMRTLVGTGRPEQRYQHNAYVAKTHGAHIRFLLNWASRDPSMRDEAMRYAKASAEYLLGELEPKDAPLAWWPPTYGRKPLDYDPKTDGPYRKTAMIGNEPEGAVKYRGEVMLVYPADVASAFLAYADATGDARFLVAAKGIAETYLKVRRADGSWPLKMKLATGEPIGTNALVPSRLVNLFESLYARDGSLKWRQAADDTFAWLEAHPLTDWNWDGQFEDIKPEAAYKNPTKHNACDTMFYILNRFPGDAAWLKKCREILAFCEKRFVVWKAPANHPAWPAPSVLEQYSCFTPIDASAAKMIRAYLALYKAEGRAEDLAKARALADTITRVQKPSGRIPTFWEGVQTNDSGLSDERYDWLNCMAAAAEALLLTDEAVRAAPPVRANRLDGRIGRKFDALLAARHFSHEARTTYYAETTNAFRTCYDDVHTDGIDYPHSKWHQGAGLWQGEYWGKTMLGAANAIEYGAPDGYREWARQAALDFVRDFQKPDGYLATYRDPDFLGGPDGKGGETFCWNVWSRKYTIWALVELARVCDEPRLLAAAEKVADHLIGQLKRLDRKVTATGYFNGIPSASILKPMVLLYERTGKKTYLDFCRALVAELDQADGARPNLVANAFKPGPLADWYENPAYWAKAYEIMSVYEGLVEYARVTGEKRPLEAAQRAADAIGQDEGNVLGSVGYHDHFMHAARRVNAVTEICDVIHWIFLQRELYREDHDVRRLDFIESAFLNALQAGVHRNGKWGCHDVRSHGYTQVTAPFEVEMHYHGCCVDNAPRGFAAYAETIATEGADGVAELNFYTDARASSAGVDFTIRGDYPISNRVTVEATCASPKKVAFRVPGWCRKMTVDGKVANGPRYVVELSGPHAFDIVFEMEPVIHDRDPKALVADKDDRPNFELVPALWCSTYSAIDTMRATVTRGPLLLAKAKATGMPDGEIFTAKTVNGKGYKATLRLGRPCGTWGSWILSLEKDGDRQTLPVVDYATAADYEDYRNPFSVWF